MTKTQNIVLQDLYPSPTNPRKNFPEESLEELAKNFKTLGQIENLVVRKQRKGYEVVCGERRLKAAKIAKLETLSCEIRELSDDEVLEIQISIKNTLRKVIGTRYINQKVSGKMGNMNPRRLLKPLVNYLVVIVIGIYHQVIL